MQYRPLGRSGLNASVVGLGTWVLGGGPVWGRDTDDAESIRTALGVCNVTLDELKEYLGCGAIASNQLRYSMLFRDPERDILSFCAKNRLATLTYMSLEQGLLTGKIGPDRRFSQNEFRSNAFWNPWLMPVNRQRVLDMLAGWQDLTRKYQCSLTQLAIAWTVAQSGVTHALIGARTVAQVQENARGGELVLMPSDVKRIRNDVLSLGEPLRKD